MENQALNLLQEYMGTGLIVSMFLISLIYLWIVEKRKPVRILFIYVPVILLLVFFNPLFAKLVYRVADDEIYYRILWLLPMTIVTAFAIVDVFGKLEGVKKAAFGVVSALVVMISGSFIYNNPYFERAENLYHVPQTVVDICDAIEVEGREVKAVFPLEMLQYVRQYSPVVCMPYGREILVDAWGQWNEIYDVMEMEVVRAGWLVERCRKQSVVYIILPAEKEVKGSFEENGFEVFANIDNYVVYKDTTVDLTAIFEQ